MEYKYEGCGGGQLDKGSKSWLVMVMVMVMELMVKEGDVMKSHLHQAKSTFVKSRSVDLIARPPTHIMQVAPRVLKKSLKIPFLICLRGGHTRCNERKREREREAIESLQVCYEVRPSKLEMKIQHLLQVRVLSLAVFPTKMQNPTIMN